MRIFLGFLVVAAAFAGAYWLQSGLEAEAYTGFGRNETTGRVMHDTELHRRADWQTPVAIFVAVTGLGAGIAIMASGLRRRGV